MPKRMKIPKDLRDNLLVEARHQCSKCHEKTTHIHHIVRLADGGSNEYDNLIVLCPTCHDNAHTEHVTPDQLRLYKQRWVTACRLTDMGMHRFTDKTELEPLSMFEQPGEGSDDLLERVERNLLSARDEQALAAAVLGAEQSLAAEESSERRARLLWKIGWAYSRWSRYREAIGEFAKGRDLWVSIANDTTAELEKRQLAWNNAARARGAIALIEFYRGHVANAERELLAEESGVPAGLRTEITHNHTRAIIGVERTPRFVNLEYLEQPVREWLSAAEMQSLAEPAIDLEQATAAGEAVLGDHEAGWSELIGNAYTALSRAQQRQGLGWGTIGDALMELAKWWTENDWQRSFRLSLASLSCYRQIEAPYRFGIAVAHAALGRALYRALKDRPDHPGFSSIVLNRQPLCERVYRVSDALLGAAFKINPTDHTGALRAARSRVSLKFDYETNRRSPSVRPLVNDIANIRAKHSARQAEREALIDTVLEFRMRVWAASRAVAEQIDAPTDRGLRHLFESAETLGCLRLQAQIANEFKRFLGEDAIQKGLSVADALGEASRGAAIL